ncbi:MAG: peptidoglycan-binding domain-containing protein [Candidatus Uhrbacteria bacterium]
MQTPKLLLTSMFMVFGVLPLAASAATVVPVTKCVTAATRASRAGYQVRLEKDITPYLQNAKAASAIKKYRDNLDIAWEAMEEPYCGFGSYGPKSAIHSYSKNVERERGTFVAAVKSLSKGAVVAATATSTPVVPPVAPVVVKKIERVVPVVVAPKVSIPSGLRRGMRSEGVKALQKYLASHYKVSADDLVTGYFGPTTEKYLVKFQIEKEIITNASTSGAGLFGPKTARVLNGN